MNKQRKKLIYRSWHRGTKEMDIILGKFADKFIPTCSEDTIASYELLLKENDPDLYNWISGRENPPEPIASNDSLRKIIDSYK
ncbi:MAG: succinate dehydrogenase assembly factor 2 family protein [Alphaproteobacteria bacterium]|nr:MAG: succinate dehydrogenase assembly factor 2 family protein [Alphaproteobacteria bacterium]